MAIDRIEPEQRASPARAEHPHDAEARARSEVAPAAHALTPEQSRRIAQLRNAEPGRTREARIATQIEIAAVREGVEDALAPEDRQKLEALRPDLAVADLQTRERALRAWQAIYARYRAAPRPRGQVPPALVAPLRPLRDSYPEGPLGRPAPGTQGPLVVAPPAPPLAPAGRPAPVADPATGQVLAPAGDRMIDPVTGTIWQRAGRLYVDPATGRVIPAP